MINPPVTQVPGATGAQSSVLASHLMVCDVLRLSLVVVAVICDVLFSTFEVLTLSCELVKRSCDVLRCSWEVLRLICAVAMRVCRVDWFNREVLCVSCEVLLLTMAVLQRVNSPPPNS